MTASACDTSFLVAPGPDCEKVPVHAVVHFDPTQLWAEDLETGKTLRLAARRDARWTFEPGPPPALVDPVARSVVHDGNIIYQACYDNVALDAIVVGDHARVVLGPFDLELVTNLLE
jgi:hypothetical protein